MIPSIKYIKSRLPGYIFLVNDYKSQSIIPLTYYQVARCRVGKQTWLTT